MSLHNNQKYLIYAIRESDYTRSMLRSLQTYAPHFKKSTDGVNLRIRLISVHDKEDKKLLEKIENEYGYGVNPALLIKPNKEVLEENEIYEFVRNTAVGGKQVGSNMSRESPMGKMMDKPVSQPTEIDALAPPDDDTDSLPRTKRTSTGAVNETVRSKSKSDIQNSSIRNTGDDMTDGKRGRTGKANKDNWKPEKSGKYNNPPSKSDVSLMKKFGEEVNSGINDEEITNYFKKAGGVKQGRKKY